MLKNNNFRNSVIKTFVVSILFVALLCFTGILVQKYIDTTHMIRSHPQVSCQVVEVVWSTDDPLVGNFTVTVEDEKNVSKTMNCDLPANALHDRNNCIYRETYTFWAYFDSSTNDLVFTLPRRSDIIFLLVFVLIVLICTFFATLLVCGECFSYKYIQ